MVEAKDFPIIMPLGIQAGQEMRLGEALDHLAIEMMAHRSDLLELARDPHKDDQEQEYYRRRAIDLERYATAITSLALQVDRERWEKGTFEGLPGLARQNGITLPAWMTKEK